MIPVAFDYIRPSTVDDAVRALAEAGDEAKVLAGGQSLLPVLRLRLAAPALLVDLGGLPQLRGIREDGDVIVVGAMTTHAEVASSELISRAVPLLSQAAITVGDRQVRHRGTLGGSLAHADPAADLPTIAVALDAQLIVSGPSGKRTIAAGDFFTDVFTTALADGEILTEIRFPRFDGWGTHYAKVNRTAQAWATIGVAAAVQRVNGSISQARVALTNMGPKPLRAIGVEQALAKGDIAAAADLAAEGTSPMSDSSASADYRSHLVRVITRRALNAAMGN